MVQNFSHQNSSSKGNVSGLAGHYNAWQGLSVKNTFLDFEDIDEDPFDTSIKSAPALLANCLLPLDESLLSVNSLKSRNSHKGNTLCAVAEASAEAETIELAEPRITEPRITTMHSGLADHYNAWQGLAVKNTFLDYEDNDLVLLDASNKSAPAQLANCLLPLDDSLLSVNSLKLNLDMDDSLKSVNSLKSRNSYKGNTLCAVAEASAEAETIEPAEPLVTTMHIRNIPNRCTKEEVMRHVDQLGFADQYDLFHMPMDKQRKSNLGYAFINFVEPQTASLFQKKMKGACVAGDRVQNCKKACTVVPANVQGVQNYVNNLVESGKPLDLLFVPEGMQDGIADRVYDTATRYQAGTIISL